MNESQLETFLHVCGLDENGNSIDAIGQAYLENQKFESVRLSPYLATMRKVQLWFMKAGDSRILSFQNQIRTFEALQYIENKETTASSHHEEQLLNKLRATGLSYIIFRVHDHFELKENPLRFGWALESLFQQLGIGYHCINRFLDQRYAYDPQSNTISIVKSEN
jgi:hypothetical protein